MHTYQIQKATTDVSIELRIVDSGDGTPETGVVWNTAGLDLQYRRDGAASTAITEATLAALTTAHTDGGFLHIGNGVYRLDLPDAACATGVDKVVVHGTVTGMVVIGCIIQLVDYDPFDAVRMGMTALPNANADAAGGLPISDAGALDLDTILGRITANVALASVCTEARLAELGAANIPTDIDALLARLVGTIAAGTHNAQSGDSFARIGVAGAGLTNIDLPNQTMDITGNLSGSVGSVTGAVGSVTGAVGSVTGSVTVGTNNDKTGYSLTSEFRIRTNTALSNFSFLMVDSAGDPATGLTVTAQRSIDGAAFGACANAVAELSNGLYLIDLAASDLNGTVITLRFTAAGADDRILTIITQTE